MLISYRYHRRIGREHQLQPRIIARVLRKQVPEFSLESIPHEEENSAPQSCCISPRRKAY